jgi:hypothetical protein
MFRIFVAKEFEAENIIYTPKRPINSSLTLETRGRISSQYVHVCFLFSFRFVCFKLQFMLEDCNEI